MTKTKDKDNVGNGRRSVPPILLGSKTTGRPTETVGSGVVGTTVPPVGLWVTPLTLRGVWRSVYIPTFTQEQSES